jgi:hypothetical protein
MDRGGRRFPAARLTGHRVFTRLVAALVLVAPALLSGAGAPSQGWAATPAGHWTSIGPSRVTAPAKGTFGSYSAVGRLTTIAVDPVDPQIIYAASAGQLGHEGSGVWKTTDGGATWTPITDDVPTLTTLSIGAIAIDPTNHDRVYFVAVDEGLYRSDDAGASWTHVSGDLHVRSNTDTGDWVVLLVNPANANILFVTSDLGVQRSMDGGQTWAVSLNGGDPLLDAMDPSNNATSLVMDPLNPDLMYAAIRGKGVYKTTNASDASGAEWKPQNLTKLPFGTVPMGRGVLLAISHPTATTPATVYAIFPRWGYYGIDWDLYRTVNGVDWEMQSTPCVNTDPYRCFVTILAADPAETDQVYVGGGPLWVSSDGGEKFVTVPTTDNDRQPASPHGDYWELVTHPTNHAVLYVGTDGGIYESSNHGAEGTWTFIGAGISIAEMYDIALADTAAVRAISGTQDNGNILYTGNLEWVHLPVDRYRNPPYDDDLGIYGGDGAAVAIDPANANRFYAAFDNRGSTAVSIDGGATFDAIANGIAGKANCGIWNMTFQLGTHPTNANVLLESCNSLWRATTATPPGSWTELFSPPPTLPCTDPKTDSQTWPKGVPLCERVIRSAVQGDLDVYYAGTDRGRLFAAVGGTGWSTTPVFTNPQSLLVSDLEVDPLHQELLYASFAPVTTVDRDCVTKAGLNRIYQLTRQSTGPVTVSALDITSNLPVGLCVNALAIDPVVARTVYAGTNKGVYRGRSNSAGGPWTWESYIDGMPPADVRDLEVHPVTGHIFAATFGRGAFEVTPETNSPPELTVPGPQTVDFHDWLSFGVSATDSDAGDTLSFSATGLPAGLNLTDNGDRTATVSGLVTDVPKVYTATISVSDGTNPPVSATVQITVTKEQTATVYTGPLVIANGLPVTLAGNLFEDDLTPISGRTLTLSVGSQSCTGTTGSDGIASCVIPTVSSPLGQVTVKANFAGDAYYLPSSESKTAIVFAFPERGDFVLGDSAVATAGPTTTLTYWGAQWQTQNGASSGVAVPPFKGFAATLTLTPPTCGATWSTQPGTSSKPVATVPAYMGVAVASAVTQSGSTISGNIVQIVVIKTDPGYVPDPSYTGTGTLVATYCSLP